MRSILTALTIGLAAATMAYAHTGDAPSADRAAGLLTCETLPNVSLVFGRTRVATCTFVADGDGAVQAYGAILPPRADDDGTDARTLVWRVVTAGGAMRPGMLHGTFRPATGPGAALHGTAARLEPVDDAAEAGVTLGSAPERLEVGALAPSALR